MKLIPLSKTKNSKYSGKYFAQVDDMDYSSLVKYNWHVSIKKSGKAYALRIMVLPNGKKSTISMHRHILGLTDSKNQGDHKDINGLNNQRGNLRICEPYENSRNKCSKINSTSKYLGVFIEPVTKPYGSYKYIRARISPNRDRKSIFLGTFKTEEDAARAYDIAALKYYGEFANLNFPNQT